MKNRNEFDQALPVQVRLPVQWGEMDAFGHVNNTQYFKYFESARIAYFNAVGVMKDMQDKQLGPILAETSCRFKRPLVFPDDVLVGAGITEYHDYGFMMRYGIFSLGQNAVTSVGSGRIVMVDYNTGGKVKPDDELLAAIRTLESVQ
ncbi:acyl-CoA thioesterase [Marinicella sediminis]|uniref:Acyl-CoA thioesterase n=1 Tax=Marinicella sediminis TaxID=1792834 RepID=A0ABV7JDZ6_9GAMM|nr:thioesterase family protein [Marinicella sediminis]